MLFDLEDLLERPSNRDLEMDDFVLAADRMIAQQCLFRDDYNSKSTYDLIIKNKVYFQNLFEAIGRELVINERDLMIELRPKASATRKILKLDETIILLALRTAFEQGVKTFSQEDYGQIHTTSMAVIERFQQWTPKPAPPWTRVYEILKSFERRRFIDLGKLIEEEKGVEIVIRPAIRGVTGEGEGYLDRIDTFINAKTDTKARHNDEQIDDRSAEEMSDEGAPE